MPNADARASPATIRACSTSRPSARREQSRSSVFGDPVEGTWDEVALEVGFTELVPKHDAKSRNRVNIDYTGTLTEERRLEGFYFAAPSRINTQPSRGTQTAQSPSRKSPSGTSSTRATTSAGTSAKARSESGPVGTEPGRP